MPSRKKSSPIRNRMEQAFVLHFDGNAEEAARAAGYKNPHKAGFRLMRRPRVTQAILFKQKAAIKGAGLALGRETAATVRNVLATWHVHRAPHGSALRLR